MTSNEVLSMYENIAGLTGRMAGAAKNGDWDGLSAMEHACANESARIETGVPMLSGDTRLRKIDLLKQILANDRAIRAVTEPWQLADVMEAAH